VPLPHTYEVSSTVAYSSRVRVKGEFMIKSHSYEETNLITKIRLNVVLIHSLEFLLSNSTSRPSTWLIFCGFLWYFLAKDSEL
jgi:hypothetical protein